VPSRKRTRRRNGRRDYLGGIRRLTATTTVLTTRRDAAYWPLLRFVEAHGHARVPIHFADDPALGRWVSAQRQADAAELERKGGREPRCASRITAARMKKLQRVGFEWTLVNRVAWDDRFAGLRRFVKKHGHARIPRNSPTTPRWACGSALSGGRTRRKAGREPRCVSRITAARIKKLQRIGFEWKVEKADAWDDRFAPLRQCVKKHGHSRVLRKLADDPSLGTWVRSQRRAYAAELERKARARSAV
jgi:hypothetical protein